MQFKEILPADCPPQEALEEGYDKLYRFVYSEDIEEKDFFSHAKLSIAAGAAPCRRASCSMFTTLDSLKKKVTKAPRLRKFKFAVVLKVPAGSGKIIENGSGHVDFWMSKDYKPLDNILGIEAIT